MTAPTRTEQPRNRKVRPRLSASLLIADLSGPEPRFLFGKRHERHRFMPGTYVFPGGRIDKCDHHDDFSTLDWNDDAKLVEKAFGSRRKRLALHAPAICALREAYEETGILIGSAADSQSTMAGFSEHGLHPALSALRLLARATTPPAYPIRYETYFFIANRDRISVEGHDLGPDSELSGLVWATGDETRDLKLPVITRWILEVALERLHDDPKLDRAVCVPDFLHACKPASQTLAAAIDGETLDHSAPEHVNWKSAGAAIVSISVVGITIGLGSPLLSTILEMRGYSATLNGLSAAVAALPP